MSIEEKCYNRIKHSRTSLDELYSLNPYRKHETVSRSLRKLTEKGEITPIMTKGYIIAYELVEQGILPKSTLNAPEAHFKPNKGYCRYRENGVCLLKKNCNNCLLN